MLWLVTDLCYQAQAKIKQYTGIPVSFGIGSTKTQAKLANYIAKAGQCGVFNLTTVEPEPVLAQVAVENVWGVGRRSAKALRTQGIQTALQLRDAPQSWIKQRFGVVLLRTVLELQGCSCLPLELSPPSRKGVTVSRSFGRPVVSLAELKQAVSTYVSRAAQKLRRDQLAATVLNVFATTSRFRTPQYQNSVSVPLPTATNDTAELIHFALQAVETIYRRDFKFKKARVILLGLAPLHLFQTHLLDSRDRHRDRRLMQTMDQINDQLGPGTIRFAVAGFEQPWQLKSQFRSQRYTTHWDELLTVKA